jgi:valacyclovir hydrolase
MTETKIELSDGHNINYVTSGSGDRVVLLMPGALGTARSDFLPQLQGDRMDLSLNPYFTKL